MHYVLFFAAIITITIMIAAEPKVLVIPILQLSGRESTGCYVMLPRTRVYGREKDK